jgi:hypothetical protein
VAAKSAMSPEQRLHKALRENNRIQVEDLLIEEKVNINGLYYGMTPLLVAVSKGNKVSSISLIHQIHIRPHAR